MVRKKEWDFRFHRGGNDDETCPRIDPAMGGGRVYGGAEWFAFVKELAQAVQKAVLVNRDRGDRVPWEVCCNTMFTCISGGTGTESGNESNFSPATDGAQVRSPSAAAPGHWSCGDSVWARSRSVPWNSEAGRELAQLSNS